MKKFLSIIAALVLAVAFAGCGEYRAPTTSEIGGTGNGTQTSGTGGGEEVTSTFTVSLVYNGQPFAVSEDISAIWTDEISGVKYTAKFNAQGVATINNLDGDFIVTLSSAPTGYAYDPNIYNVNNYSTDIDVTIYELTEMGKYSTVSYMTYVHGVAQNSVKASSVPSVGAYSITLKSPEDVAYFEFIPTEIGTYSITSVMDTTDNVINPILDGYAASSGGYLNYLKTVDGGAASNTYTKNFVYTMDLESRGNRFVFALRTTSIKADAFPVSLYVILAYDGGLDDSYGLSVQTPQENFVQQTKPKGSFTYCALTNNMILDSSQYKYNPEVGYYCKYDSVLGEFEYYDEAKTQPILLYVKITEVCRVLDLSFIGVDSDTGSYLSMHCNGKNYDSFFRYVDENGAMYTETDPVTQVTTLQKGGYSLYVNSDGCYPVTQELKEFLTDFNISQRLFNDGNGEAESRGFKSAEGDQWLFACGIYVR